MIKKKEVNSPITSIVFGSYQGYSYLKASIGSGFGAVAVPKEKPPKR